MKWAKEDDERKKEKMQEAIEEQRHREKQEEQLKRKMNEKQSATAPTPVKKPKSSHGAAIRSESSKVCVLCEE